MAQNKGQYDLDKKTVKIWAFSSGNVDMYKCLTGKDTRETKSRKSCHNQKKYYYFPRKWFEKTKCHCKKQYKVVNKDNKDNYNKYNRDEDKTDKDKSDHENIIEEFNTKLENIRIKVKFDKLLKIKTNNIVSLYLLIIKALNPEENYA